MRSAVVFLALVASLFSSALGQVFTHIVQNKLYNAVLKKLCLFFHREMFKLTALTALGGVGTTETTPHAIAER